MFPSAQNKRAYRFVFALCARAALALSGCRPASNPDATINRAYDWYVQTLKSGQDPLQRARTGLRSLATDRFLASVGSIHPDFESSALIDPQAFDARLAVENVDTKGSAATARVILDGRAIGRQTLNIYLLKEENAWKIDDVKLVDQGDL